MRVVYQQVFWNYAAKCESIFVKFGKLSFGGRIKLEFWNRSYFGGQTQESGFPSSEISLVLIFICKQFSSQG